VRGSAGRQSSPTEGRVSLKKWELWSLVCHGSSKQCEWREGGPESRAQRLHSASPSWLVTGRLPLSPLRRGACSRARGGEGGHENGGLQEATFGVGGKLVGSGDDRATLHCPQRHSRASLTGGVLPGPDHEGICSHAVCAPAPAPLPARPSDVRRPRCSVLLLCLLWGAVCQLSKVRREMPAASALRSPRAPLPFEPETASTFSALLPRVANSAVELRSGNEAAMGSTAVQEAARSQPRQNALSAP